MFHSLPAAVSYRDILSSGKGGRMEGDCITPEVPHLSVPKSIVQVLKKTNSFFNILPCTIVLSSESRGLLDGTM